MKAVLWVVECRDSKAAEWSVCGMHGCSSRAEARDLQGAVRNAWRFTRIVRYVREGA